MIGWRYRGDAESSEERVERGERTKASGGRGSERSELETMLIEG
jgi:hypothetical protein